jgi:hypothetical protein
MKKQSINNETATDVYILLADAVFRPILFSTPMVQAILDGNKTQARRTIKPQPLRQLFDVNMGYWSEEPTDLKQPYIKSKYNVGDIMWVRETFAKMFEIHEELVGKDREDMGYWYKTDGELSEAPFYVDGYKWKPSIFMPKEACRIFLEVKNVRVERLHDISNEDAKNEGIENHYLLKDSGYQHYTRPDKFIPFGSEDAERTSFFSLWMSINGNESLDANPWVWVYEFKRIDRPSGFC